MPPTPPDYGYGPVNYANEGGNDPFGAFDNRIRYNDMIRHQMVSQYQQNVVRPSTMTLSQSRDVATKGRFQYGVQGGQDPRMYERQSSLSRLAYGTSLARGMVDIGMYGAAEAGLTAMGVGTMGAMTLPLLATLAPMHFINKGVQNAVDRRKFMHSIASDVEQYRDTLGFSGGLSYGQASTLGRRLESSMSSPGQFFSKEQQSKIHKIGLSNDLLSAKGAGLDSGTIGQYEKNVKELIKTTEDVVKLLQTTTEGGLSVIKEMKQKGFGNIQQIRQQVVQAKAFGSLTGLGAQNMMQIGAAGAQAVQGTPWSSSAGAGAFQLGAAQAHMIAQASPAGAYAVQRAGGTAASGAAIGGFMMNVLQSGIGTKMAAYAMNADGTPNQDRTRRLLSGKAGAYEISTGANQTGYAMGENRVRFGMFKEDMWNAMNPQAQMRTADVAFEAWSSQRPYSSAKNKAFVFAGQFTNDPRQQRLIYESLLSNKGYAQISAASRAQEIGLNQYRSKRRLGPVAKDIVGGYKAFTGFFDDVGEAIAGESGGLITGMTKSWDETKSMLGRVGEVTLQGVGVWDKYGGINRAKYGNVTEAAKRSYGLFQTTPAARMSFDLASKEDIQSLSVTPSVGADINVLGMLGKTSAGSVNYAIQKMWQSQSEGRPGEWIKDPNVTSALGIDPGKIRKDKLDEYTLGTLSKMRGQVKTISKEHSDAQSDFDKMFPLKSEDRARAMAQVEAGRRVMTRNGGDLSFNPTVGVGKIEQLTKESRRTEWRPGQIGVNELDETKVWSTGAPTDPVIRRLLEAEEKWRKVGDVDLGIETGEVAVNRAKKAARTAIDKVVGGRYEKSQLKMELSGKLTTVGGGYTKEYAATAKKLKGLGFDVGIEDDRTKLFETMTGLLKKEESEGGIKKGTTEYNIFQAGLPLMKNAEDVIEAAKALNLTGTAEEVVRRRGMVKSAMARITEGSGFKDDDQREKFKSLYERGLGLQGSKERLGKKEARKFVTEFESQLKDLGMNKVALLDKTDDASIFTGFLASDTQSKKHQTVTDKIDEIFSNLAVIDKIRKDSKAVGDIIIDGKPKGITAKDDLEKFEKDISRDKDKLTMEIAAGKYRETSQGKSIDSTVRPPVLNYWNNRWVL